MNIAERLRELWGEMPIAHRALMAAAGAVVVLAGLGFMRWVSTPSYTVLFAGMDASETSGVIDELESLGADYKLEGTSVMVPRSQLFDLRARLAGAGISGSPAPIGYELLDGEGLSVSDFKQQVDLKRAVEGEWARTISKFDGVRSATVHIVIPEDELFREATEPAKATVVVDPSRTLAPHEVDTIVNAIAGGVDGLSPSDVTVADTAGNTLNMPDSTGGTFGTASRNLQATRAWEAAAASNAMRQLEAIYGPGRASVTVSAVLDFDETSTEQEVYDPESATSLREQTIDERYSGAGSPPGGVVGVDGGPDVSEDTTTTEYERNELTREYGVDRTVTRTVNAPGTPERISVAVTVDDGTLTGNTVPDTAAVEALVAAAVGLDANRDTIEVLSHPFPAVDTEAAAPSFALQGIVDMIPQVLGGLTLLVVAIALFGMSRRGSSSDEEITWLPAPAPIPGVSGGSIGALPAGAEQPALAGVGARAPAPGLDLTSAPALPGGNVGQLADRKPDEVASLLRSWLNEESGE